jgi:hypothetical protein
VCQPIRHSFISGLSLDTLDTMQNGGSAFHHVTYYIMNIILDPLLAPVTPTRRGMTTRSLNISCERTDYWHTTMNPLTINVVPKEANPQKEGWRVTLRGIPSAPVNAVSYASAIYAVISSSSSRRPCRDFQHSHVTRAFASATPRCIHTTKFQCIPLTNDAGQLALHGGQMRARHGCLSCEAASPLPDAWKWCENFISCQARNSRCHQAVLI